MRTEVAESASHMAQATRSHDHVRTPFLALHQLLTPIVSDQHSVSSHYATCLSHSSKFWRAKGASSPVRRQHIFVLFRSCKHMFCMDSACVLYSYVQKFM